MRVNRASSPFEFPYPNPNPVLADLVSVTFSNAIWACGKKGGKEKNKYGHGHREVNCNWARGKNPVYGTVYGASARCGSRRQNPAQEGLIKFG